jgi:putative oxidoreductase
MNDTRERWTSIGLLVLRLGTAGLLIFGHGWGKLAHFAERAPQFANPIGIGPVPSLALVVLAEVFCQLALALGLWTRLAAVPPVIFFLVAGFIQHAADPWGRKELAFAFLVPHLTLLIAGAGRYSLDARRAGRRR